MDDEQLLRVVTTALQIAVDATIEVTALQACLAQAGTLTAEQIVAMRDAIKAKFGQDYAALQSPTAAPDRHLAARLEAFLRQLDTRPH